MQTITDKEIEKIFDWADKNNLSGKRLTSTKYGWGVDIKHEDFMEKGFLIIRNGIPRDKELIKNITHLNLNQKQLKDLPVELFKLEQLTHLNLAKNHLDKLPQEIGNLTNLEYLDISGNSIIEFPKEIGKLINLKYFDLNWNGIYSDKDEEIPVLIPSEIGNLINLEYLDLHSLYGLKKLPKEIGNLINLKSLNYRYTDIKEIPSELSNLINLEKLNGEPYIQMKTKDANISDSKSYIQTQTKKIFSTKEKGNLAFPHKNLLLKGVPGTGKSHLLEAIIENQLNLKNSPDNICRINIHSASSNADLMQGIGINSNEGNIEYKEKQGLIYNHIKKALFAPNQPFVLVLEEIQENSLNELIGDLIYLIEEKKRVTVDTGKFEDGQEYAYQDFIEEVLNDERNKHSIEIPYLVDTSTAYRKMVLPSNLYVFCTSNYRDDKKVIEDNLLRRFDVVEVYPKNQAQLGETVFKSKEVSDFLEKLNDAILKKFDAEIHPDRYLVGHANWLDITEEDNEANKKLFYTALLKVIVEFKEIREIDFHTYTQAILEEVLKDSELSERLQNYIKACGFEYKSYKEMVEKLQKQIYDFLK